MNDEIDQTMQRTKRYWYVDGLPDIVFGVLLLLLALYFYLKTILPPDSTLSNMLTVGFVLLVVGCGWFGGKIINYFKERLTYPRTGYVSYTKPKTSHRLATGIVAMLIASLLTALIATSPGSLFLIPTLMGVLIGLAMLYFGSKIGLMRYYVFAALSALIGVGLSLTHISTDLSGAIYYFAMGFVLLVTGVFTLRNYLRQTEAMEEDLDERLD